jgi:hypothetical protein
MRFCDGSVDKLKVRLVAKGLSRIKGQDYDEMFAQFLAFNSLHLALSMITATSFIPQQLNVQAAVLYGELKGTIYMRLSQGYRDGNKLADLKSCIYRLSQSLRN